MDLEEIQRAIELLPPDRQRALANRIGKRLAWRAREKRVRKARFVNRRLFYKSPALLWTVVSLLAFLIAEGAIFRLGWYNKYLEPDSSAGMVESYLFWLSHSHPVKVPQVMVIGDSRIAEGFSGPIAEKAAGNRIHFWNFGIGGISPRVWYYMLRDGDPTRRRFSAIVMALDRYTDEDGWDSWSDRTIDLNFVIGRLRLIDCWDFARSMTTMESRGKVLSGCLLRGITLRRDAQELLRNYSDRLKRSKDWRNNGLTYISDYGGRDENLEGLTADFEHRTIHFPPGLSKLRHDSIQAMVMPPPAPQSGDTTRYRELWLNRIIELYKNSPTKLIFLQLPRAPILKPESAQPATWLRSAVKRPRVFALPEITFRDLERPDVFFDGLHLNRIGRGLFSEKIAEQVPPLIGIQ
jgi:hypothetical protein